MSKSLIIVAISYGYFLLAFAFSRRPEIVPSQTKIIATVSFLVALVGLYFSRRRYGMWLLVGSYIGFTVYEVLDPFVQAPWTQLSVQCALLAISISFTVTLDKFLPQMFACLAIALFNQTSYFMGAPALLVSGSFLARGSISSTMIALNSLFIIFGWRRMLKQAQENDLRIERLITRIEQLKNSQKFLKEWRKLVVQIHETTLNTIRSILALSTIPLEEIKNKLQPTRDLNSARNLETKEFRAGTLVSAIRAGVDSAATAEKVRLISQGVNLGIDSQIAEVIESVVREAIRNSAIHARAKNIEILWKTTLTPSTNQLTPESGQITIEIKDDGAIASEKNETGIGTQLVMSKSINSLGGTFEKHYFEGQGTLVRIGLPSRTSNSEENEMTLPVTNAVALGRYMAFLTLFGSAMIGLVFYPLLGIWWPGQILAQLSGFVAHSLLLYLAFIRRKNLGWISSITIAVLLLMEVAALNLDPLTCTSAQPIQWLFNTTVYGIFVIMLVGKWQVSAVAYPIFLYLAKQLHPLIPDSCNYIFAFPLINTLMSFLFVWMVFYVVYKSLEAVESFQKNRVRQGEELNKSIRDHELAYQRIALLDSEGDCLIQDLINKSGPLSIADESNLRLLDSKLRAELQMEPGSNSGLTDIAYRFINEAVAHGRWLNVKSIHGDEDNRPLPELVNKLLIEYASEISSGSTIQVLVTDEFARLTIIDRGNASILPERIRECVKFLQDSDFEVSIDTRHSENERFFSLTRKKKGISGSQKASQ